MSGVASATVPGVDTLQLVTRASQPINRIGPAFYFVPETVAVGKEHGLDGFRFYFLGRGGVLGDVEWPIVSSAFGYFKPSLVEKMWTTAKQRYPVADGARDYLGCLQDFGRAHLSAVDGLEAFCEAAAAVNDAARADPSGLPLWAGLASQPLAEDLPAKAMQLIATLRELRGSAHLVAVVASELPTPVAHRIHRPKDLAAFGWSEEDIRVPTDEDRSLLDAANDLTNRLMAPAYSVLDEDGAAALLHGLDGAVAALPDA
jgi:hypothetical protein